MRLPRIFAVLVCSVVLAAHLAGAEELPLTLREAQDLAVERNDLLEAGRAEVRAAEARRMQSAAGYLPSLRFSQGYAYTNDPVNVFGFRLKQQRFTQEDFDVSRLNEPDAISNWQTKGDLALPLFDGGGSWYQRKQANRGFAAAEADFAQRSEQVRYETAGAYWGQVLAREALNAVRDGLETARAHARDAEARYRQETIALPDLLAARVRVAELEEETILAESRLANAEESMSLVLGLDVSARIVTRDSLQRREAAWNADTLVVAALGQRPDLRAVEYRADAARKGAVAARGPFWPRLDAYLSAEINAEKFLDHDGDSWTTGAMLTWDLFAGGRSRGGSREAQAQAAAATAVAAFEKKRAEREVRQAHRELSSAGKRVDVAEAALEQAAERLRITELLYREGAATTTDLLDAQAGETQARLRRVQSLHDLNVGIARLTFVVGGTLD